MRSLAAAVLVLAAGPVFCQTYSLKTYAGGALPENVAGASASLGGVYGVAADKAGNLYLSLGEYHTVVRMDAATGTLARVAGTGTAGTDGDGVPAVSAQLSGPSALALDADGNLWIADTRNFRVRKVAGGNMTTAAGNGTQGYGGDGGSAVNARFDAVAGVAVDASGNLYIADLFNHVVRKVTAGVVTTVAGDGTYGSGGDNGPATSAQLSGPAAVAVDAAGNLYIADVYDNRIRRVSGGVITTVAGTGTAGFSGDKGQGTAATLRQPADLAFDAAGNLYIADYGNNRIRMVASNGVITTVAGNGSTTLSGESVAATSAGLAAPRRIASDGSGNLYIADGGRLRKVTAKGVITTVAGAGTPAGENGPATSAQMLSPQGLALDAAGNLYLTDAGTGRVLKVAGGTLSRVAGTGIPGFSGDNGAAASAQLNTPSGVAVDAAGTLYVADSVNARVRKISGGTITTFAGGGTTFGDNGPANKAQLTAPEGLALDASGNLYIADVNRVRAVTGGVIATAAGNGGVGYQGDGGVPTAARVSSPSGVAVSSSGALYIADTGNDRVRMVANNVITTVAGNGTYGFTGAGGAPTSATLGAPAAVAVDGAGDLYLTDAYRVLKVSKGKIASIAGLNGPQGIAVDAGGNVYVADPAAHRVVVLAPAGTTCAMVASPAAPQYPASGGVFAVNVQTGAGCPWAVENLPSWITVSGSLYGLGAGNLFLTVAANSDAPRTATIVAGGQNVAVTQAGTLTVVGQVTTSAGKPLAGVTVRLTGAASATAVTDSGGNYSFTGLSSAGAYTVTPALGGFGFVPVSSTFTNPASNPTANFTAWTQPRIAGFGTAFAGTLQAAPANFAAGEIVSIYGSDFCATSAAAVPTLPDRLASCMVRVDNTAIRLYYGSAGQINAVLPQTLAAGTHQLVVQRYTNTNYSQLAAQSDPQTFAVDRVAMAFLERTDGSARLLLAQYLDGGLAGPDRPVRAGDYLVLYLTGLGKKAQTFSEGAAPQRASAAVEKVEVQVEGVAAQVPYAGVQPQYPGLDQITVLLPKYTLGAGSRSVQIRITAPATGQAVTYSLDAN